VTSTGGGGGGGGGGESARLIRAEGKGRADIARVVFIATWNNINEDLNALVRRARSALGV